MGENFKYNSELPRGWAVLEFKKTCDKISLNGIKIKQKQYLSVGEYPVVDQSQDIIGGYFNDDDLLVPDAPPYIVFGDHTKTKKYIIFRFIAGADGVKVLKPLSFFEPKLFYYFIHCIKLPDKGYARHFQFLERSEIPLPPLPEQHRIVAKIEELFSSLDKGIESLKTAQQQLKVYRQAVLKWAFEGKLTEKTDKIKKHIRLEELCDFITKGTTPTKDNLFQGIGTVPFIKVYNLTFSGKLDFSIDPTFVTYETHNGFLARSKVLPGDVLMNIVGPPLGKVSIVPDTYPEWNMNQAVVRFRCKKPLLNKFLAFFLLADFNLEKMMDKSKATAGQFNLTLEICRNIEIPILFPIEEQHAIVAEIESRLSVCDKLEESIEQSLKQSESLRQSILKKAFEGKLVPQDPNDEPASVLLARIKAERENDKRENPQHDRYERLKRKRQQHDQRNQHHIRHHQ
jgi:type I restriction enzyme, S subunit